MPARRRTAQSSRRRRWFREIRRFLHIGSIILVTSGAAVASPASASERGLQITNDGRRTVVAVESKAAITLDGALDEQVWRSGRTGWRFCPGRAARRRSQRPKPTEVRLVFDRDALYHRRATAATRRASGTIINDIRKDFAAGEQDSFEVILDTFADRRNGFVFVVNRGRRQVRHPDRERRARREHELGRGVDCRDQDATPNRLDPPKFGFRSRPCASSAGADRIWGVNFSRRIRRKNESRLLVAGAARLQPVPRQSRPARCPACPTRARDATCD